MKPVNTVTHDEIVFSPRVVALRDVDVRIVIESAPGIEVVMIPRNDVKLAGLQAFGRPLALALQRAHFHFQSVLRQKAALFHHLPQRHVAGRAVINADFFLSCHGVSLS